MRFPHDLTNKHLRHLVQLGMLNLITLPILAACGTTQPIPVTTVGKPVDLVRPVLTRQAVNVTASSSTITINFDQAMDRASVERSVNIFPGEYATTSPTFSQKLVLTSMCNGTWRVRNPNTAPVAFTWDRYGGQEKSASISKASGDTLFQSSLGTSTVRIFVNNVLHQTKASSHDACAANLYSFAWSADSKSVTVTPSTPLEVGKTYSTAISAGAKNASGAVAISSPVISSVKAQAVAQVETGTLSPGGEYRFANGMVVGSTDFLYETVRISAEKVDPVALSLPQIHTPVSDFVRVKASGITEPGGQYMTVTFPYPPNVDPKTLLIGSYIPERVLKHNPRASNELILLLDNVLEINETQKTVTVRTGLPEDQGYIFVLLKRKNVTTQAQSSLGLKSQSLSYKTYCGTGFLNGPDPAFKIPLELTNCDSIKNLFDQTTINIVNSALTTIISR